jgi:hypothetical protein
MPFFRGILSCMNSMQVTRLPAQELRNAHFRHYPRAFWRLESRVNVRVGSFVWVPGSPDDLEKRPDS